MARMIYTGFMIFLYISMVSVIDAKSHGRKSKVHIIANHTKLTGTAKTTTTEPPKTAPPPPPPPKSCADDGKCTEENKKCNAELKCVCDLHYREISDGSCVPKPQLGEQCFDNVTWLECDGDGVESNCVSEEGPNRGKCVCAKGHEPSKKEKSCTPITKKLGESCGHDAECVLAYSACEKGTCICVSGFSTGDDGLCKPKEHRCPSGEPKKAKGSVVICEVDFNDTTGEIGDNCGTGHFCFVPPHTLTSAGKPHGHCCPTSSPPESAKLVCPYGDPLENATCPDRKKGDKKKATCPSGSHQCFAIQSRPHEMICCPDPCRQSVSHFDFNGQCYDYVLLGKTCELTAQCTGDAECVEEKGGKICRCKKGYTKASANQCEENR